jgi:ubiquinone/menaquinone biosynthesis C-methylase UbiE
MNNIKIISKQEFLKNNKKQDQEKVWDKISDLWNEYRKEPFDVVKNFLKDKKGKIIDIGCGNGRNMITDSGIEYYGVDFSANQIKAAENNSKERRINAKLFKSSAAKLDKNVFKDEMFDYGLCVAVLHCIDDEKKRLNALKEFYRVLKPNAEALITVWNSEDERFNGLIGDIYMSWKKDGKEHYRYYYLYDKEEFLSLLKSVGFKILEINEKETDRFSKKNLIVRVRK